MTIRRGISITGLPRTIGMLALIVSALIAAPAVSEAQTRARDITPVVIVVDVPRILSQAEASRQVQSQLEEQRRQYQQEISEREKQLQDAQAALQRERSIMAPDAFEAREQEFRTQISSVQREVQQRKAALDQALARAMGQLRQEIVQVVADVAQEEGANIVLSNQQIVLVQNELDVTDRVLALLNERKPSIDLQIPELDAIGSSE